jgi:hypothetical protein
MWWLKLLGFQWVCIRDRVATRRPGRFGLRTVRSDFMVRVPFAHDAVIAMQAGGSPNAAGAAITVALCGGWDHPPPCPLAPHYVTTVPTAETVTLRVLFATERANGRTRRGYVRSSATR